jgi:LysM repeat protein
VVLSHDSPPLFRKTLTPCLSCATLDYDERKLLGNTTKDEGRGKVRRERDNRRAGEGRWQWLPWAALAAILILLVLVLAVGIPMVTRRAAKREEEPTPTAVQVVPLKVATGMTAVGIDPVAQQIQLGDKATVTARAENIANVYGIELHIQFNPAGLEVEDADSQQDGIQLQSSDFFKPDFVVQNRADNELGTIDYAVTLLAPRESVEGSGVLVTINFVSKQQGNYSVLFKEVKLASPDGLRIPAETVDGQIAVGTSIQGLVVTGTSVALVSTATPTATPVTAVDTPTATPVPPTPTPAITLDSCAYTYVVRTGDTMWSIARRFGTTMQAIAQANGIINLGYIQAGQVLCIPGGVPPPIPSPVIYVVQSGDTLWSIARRFGTTVEAIAWRNGIINPWYIHVGQRLIITEGVSPPPSYTVYIVRWGDTLWSIARRFGTTAWAIALANNLRNPNLIYVGQQLIIPV